MRWMTGLALLAACGGSTRTDTIGPADSARESVNEFMQAVADSNLAKMAMLWGTAKGPAGVTHEPADYERRIVVIHSFLRGSEHTISNDYPAQSRDARTVEVRLRRAGCEFTLPVTVVRTGQYGWLVSNLDLSIIGAPGRDCGPGADSTAPQG